MIAIVDYGMGNLRSVQKALEKIGSNAVITSSSREILKADGVVLPGVGAFDSAMQVLTRAKLIDPLIRVIQENRPFLGICLGLQLLFSSSEESGKRKGLSVVEGRVKRFKKKGLKIPHLGWNTIKIKKQDQLLAGIEENSYFYFVHSFCGVPDDRSWNVAMTQYGTEFTSAVWKNNVFATQFHPEKSQQAGHRVIKNFVKYKA